MSHKLYIKSLREPISISKSEADGISNLLADSLKLGHTHVSIEGVWSGTKGEIKFVKYPPKENDEFKKNQIQPMTKIQADLYEKQILPFQLEAESLGYGGHEWTKFYLRSQGAIRLELREPPKIKKHEKHFLIMYVRNESLFPKLQEEIESYYLYKDRVAYAKKMELEALKKQELEIDYAKK